MNDDQRVLRLIDGSVTVTVARALLGGAIAAWRHSGTLRFVSAIANRSASGTARERLQVSALALAIAGSLVAILQSFANVYVRPGIPISVPVITAAAAALVAAWPDVFIAAWPASAVGRGVRRIARRLYKPVE